MAENLAARLAGRTWPLAVALAVVLALVAGLTIWGVQSSRARRDLDAPPAAYSTDNAPTAPIARRCGDDALERPAVAPDGAVTVATTDDLTDVVNENAPGTTYWLKPGAHELPDGLYSQVIPQDGDTFVGAPGAILDGRNRNRYAFGGNATDVTVSFLTVQNFGKEADNNNEGVVNHDSAARWTVHANQIQKNAGAGVMLGSGNRLTANCLRDNGQYGFSSYHVDDVRDIVLDGNEIAGNNTDDWEKREPGCGCTGGGKFWATTGAVVTGNYVHDNRGAGLWADSNNVGFLFEKNYIEGNDAEGLMYETSYNAAILQNTFVRNALAKGPDNPGFPASAVYLSESGSDSRVPGPYNDVFRIAGNVFVDNWSGIVAWENADRFAGSPANTSTGSTTLVNSDASLDVCKNKAKISREPFIDDCRWKTQKVVVERNDFRVDTSKVPLCVRSHGCGFNGLFSNYGTYPDWSPFKADMVEHNITFKQNNVWRDNTYTGEWHFMGKEAGQAVSWDTWRSEPYRQDAQSTFG